MTDRFESVSFADLFARIDAVRAHRESFLSEVADGTVGLEGVFEVGTVDPVIAGMKVLPAIEGLPGLAKVQTRRAFADVGIEEGDHIEAVGSDAITALPAALERRAL